MKACCLLTIMWGKMALVKVLLKHLPCWHIAGSITIS